MDFTQDENGSVIKSWQRGLIPANPGGPMLVIGPMAHRAAQLAGKVEGLVG